MHQRTKLDDRSDVETLAQTIHVRDITERVAESVRTSGIESGICCVSSQETTSVVRVNECEAGFLADFADLVSRLLASGSETSTQVFGAQCASLLLGATGETIPVADGKLCLGTWQRVLLVELGGSLQSNGGEHWNVHVVGSGAHVRESSSSTSSAPI